MIERIIEAALFLAPVLAFIAWRVLAPPELPPWMIAATAGVMILLLASLVWLHQTDADNAGRSYVPARLQGGQVIEGHAGSPIQGQP